MTLGAVNLSTDLIAERGIDHVSNRCAGSLLRDNKRFLARKLAGVVYRKLLPDTQSLARQPDR